MVALQASSAAVVDGPELFGVSPAFLQLKESLPKVARAQRTTLIAGPTGVGKELIARTLHRSSPRKDKPFVTIDCGALPEHLLESELFGHRRGSFTGATHARDGLIAASDGGTLFLDEVNSLPLDAQSKLLRFLETGEYRTVGSDRVERADVWVLSATNQDLAEEVSRGRFRSDLRFRLEVLLLDVPALRLRPEDIVLLAEHFLDSLDYAGRLTPAAKAALMGHDWPGNVRELKHRIEAATVFAEDGWITPERLGLDPAGAGDADASERLPAVRSGVGVAASGGVDLPLKEQLWSLIESKGMTLGEAISVCERLLIDEALRTEEDNRSRAAARLGIHVRTIFKKLARQ